MVDVVVPGRHGVLNLLSDQQHVVLGIVHLSLVDSRHLHSGRGVSVAHRSLGADVHALLLEVVHGSHGLGLLVLEEVL